MSLTKYIRIAFIPLMACASAYAVETPDFSREILPILSDNCFYCHGPDPKRREGDLRLDEEAAAKGKRKGSIPAVVPGKSAESELVTRITSTDDDQIMPPPKSNKKLTAQQIELLKRWVDSGAKWGTHWAFAELKKSEIGDGARNPIDALVSKRLKSEGLTLAPSADKAALIRRVTLDLTGLPPTVQELDAFMADNAPDAYGKLVERQLASPSYGERMAWDWMEAARYADSNGYQGDNERTMWPWRDWVAKAYNQNLPYDQFTVWQLAGDMLPDATHEQKLATGFLRNHPINGEGGRIPEENRVDYVMDMAETTATTWLALTFNCCRCHDHKFDPLTQKDYYSLFAFFNQTEVTGGGGDPQTKPVVAISTPENEAKIEKGSAQLAELDKKISARAKELASGEKEWVAKMLAAPENQLVETKAQSKWNVLSPNQLHADKQILSVLRDASVLASGDNPANDAYLFIAKTDQEKITGIRLEVLRHESHTNNGLARSDSGNFVLTNFEVSVQRKGENNATVQTIASAEATFEQGGFKISNAFDADPKSGWAVHQGKSVDREHSAIFIFEKPIEAGPETEVSVRLRHDSKHVSHNIGRFRLSLTDERKPKLDKIPGKSNPVFAEALNTPPEKRTKEQAKAITAAHEKTDDVLTALRSQYDKEKEQLEGLKKLVPKVMVMADTKSRKTFTLEKGIYTKTKDEVHAAFPAKLAAAEPAKAQLNRLDLGRWLVSEKNPLTARVTVNRFWQMFFGIGLVKTAEDFGVQAEFPKHVELLDWLAAEFRDSGWDVKKLVRLIVTSDTYKQSSRVSKEMAERDPQNRLLARGPRFRMASWMLRDQALASSGLLVPTVGGPPVKPYQPAGIWEEATFGNKKYVQDKGDALHRRSLYTFWRRIVGPAEFFDTSSRSVCSVKPTRTNTPLHALTTLNNVTFVEAARAMAERVMLEQNEDAARLDAVFKRVLSRAPNADEKAVLLAGLERARKQFAASPAETKQFLSTGESPRNMKLNEVDHAAWATVCLTVLNLDEAVTKE